MSSKSESGSGPNAKKPRSDRDVLDEALTALREETAAASSDDSTRRAILASANRRALSTRRRRTILVRLVLPIAAVLAVSSAWAAATGRLPLVIGAISDVFRDVPDDKSASTSPVASLGSAATHVSPTASASTNAAADAEPIVANDADAGAPAEPIVVRKPAAPPSAIATTSTIANANPNANERADASVVMTPGVATSLAPDPEETLYRTAHVAHFTEHDWSKALAGWDAYLAAHPKGRFAPEARYNRALTLVRLGRGDEARAALQPFADGVTFGGYRQKEAKALLDALRTIDIAADR